MKVAIIYSYLSGLIFAALLAKEGYSLKIYKQHDKIG